MGYPIPPEPPSPGDGQDLAVDPTPDPPLYPHDPDVGEPR